MVLESRGELSLCLVDYSRCQSEENTRWWRVVKQPKKHILVNTRVCVCGIDFKYPKTGVTKQSNEKTSNGIKIQEVKKKKIPNERKNVKMVVIS